MAFHELRIEANRIKHFALHWPGDMQRTVLLCHGWLDQCFSWVQVANELQGSGRSILAIDWRGHGRSERIGAGGYYYFTDYVLDLKELIEAHCTHPPHLVGHSMGGVVCGMLAGTQTCSIRSVSLVEGLGPSATKSNKEEESLDVWALKRWLREMGLSSAKELPPLPSLEEAAKRLRLVEGKLSREASLELAQHATHLLPNGSRRWAYDPLHRTHSPTPFRPERLCELFAQIDIPKNLIFGDEGMSIPKERHRALEPCTTQTIMGAGHNIHWTHPQELAALLESYFTKVEKKA